MVSPGFQTFTHDHSLMVATVFSTMGMPPMMGMPMMGPMGTSTVPDTSFAVWNGTGTTLVTTDALPSGMQGTQPNLSWDDKTLVFVAPTYGSIATQANDVQGGLGGAGGDDHFMGGSLWKASFNATTAFPAARVLATAAKKAGAFRIFSITRQMTEVSGSSARSSM